MSDAFSLPPLGLIDLSRPDAERGYAHSFIAGLVAEYRRKAAPWLVIADACYNTFEFGTPDGEPPEDDLVINTIADSVLACVDVQTKEPIRGQLDPVETGEPGEFYWNGPQALGLQLGLAPEQVAEYVDPQTGDAMYPLPLDEAQADQLQPLVAAGYVKPDHLVKVNDALISDTYQLLHDLFWRRSCVDDRVEQHVLWTGVQGWNTPLYEWDDDRKRHVIRDLSIRQTYIDPTVAMIDDAAYAGVDLVIGADQAKRLYPAIADRIDASAAAGQPQTSDGVYLGEVATQQYERRIVTLRIFWLRDQPCLYPPLIAYERGLLDVRAVPDAAALLSAQPPTSNDYRGRPDAGQIPVPGADDQATEQGLRGDVVQGRLDAARRAQGLDPREPGDLEEAMAREVGGDDADQLRAGAGANAVSPDAEPVGVDENGVPLGTPLREAYFIPGTDEEVTPGDDRWPTYNCLRQITLINEAVVDDRECESWDIPLLHNVNVPLKGKPFGVGEPYRLWKAQKARTRVLNNIAEHTDFYAKPISFISQSMYDSLVERYQDGAVKGGRTLVAPDDVYQAAGGKLNSVVDPPELSPALMTFEQILEQAIEKSAGHTDVLQGRAQSNVESGKMVEALTMNAASAIGYKSNRSGQSVYRMIRLMLHNLVWRLEVEDVAQVISKYKPGILAVIVERARKLEWDVEVTVSSGNGVVKVRRKQDAREDLAAQAITMETYRERAGIDHRVEQQREKQAVEDMGQLSALAGQAGMGQEAPGGAGGGRPPRGGGGGGASPRSSGKG